MPYKNIIFVKLLWRDLLFEDGRFIEKLTDDQKGLYLMLLLLAGATNNNIPESVKSIKRMLNLAEKDEKIAENLSKICLFYPKLVRINGCYKFKNFKKLHNYIGKSFGETSEVLDKNRIDKIRIDKILHSFKDKYRERFKQEYVVNYHKDVSIIKSLLTVLSDAELEELIVKFFAFNDDFVKRAGHTIGVFKSMVNRLRSFEKKEMNAL